MSKKLNSQGREEVIKGNITEAIRLYEQSIEYDASSVNYEQLARCYLIRNQTNEAEKYIHQGLSFNPTGELYFEYSHFLCRNQRWSETLSMLSKIENFACWMKDLTYSLQEESLLMPCLKNILKQKNEVRLPHKLFSLYLETYCYHHLQQTEKFTSKVKLLEEYNSWDDDKRSVKEELVKDVMLLKKLKNNSTSSSRSQLVKGIEYEPSKENNQDKYMNLTTKASASVEILSEPKHAQLKTKSNDDVESSIGSIISSCESKPT